MTARAPVYIDSGKLHVFEDGDTLPPWLSPSSMAWENLTGVPAGITQLADLTGPGYAKVDAAGAWSVQAAIPQADVSGLTTALAGLQPLSARLTSIAGLTDAAGWLHDDGTGNWALTTPTKSDVGLSLVENTALSTWGGSTSLTTLGTVASGIWHGTAIADAYISSAATWNAKEGGLGNPSTSGYLLSSTSAGVRSWVAPYSLPTATASVLGGVKVGTGLSISSSVLSVSYGTAAGTACVGNDSRLSDSRTPTAHAMDGALHTISGKTAGQALIATSATAFGFVTVSGDATLSGTGALTLASLLTAGSAGSATSVPTLTWDAKGRLTAVGSATITAAGIGALTTVTGDATSRAANTVYAAPNGSAGTATFRALVAADIPSLSYLPLAGGTLTGQLLGTSTVMTGYSVTGLSLGLGTTGMFIGTADGASLSAYDLKLSSWYGIGLYCSYDATTRGYLDLRAGNLYMTGNISAGSLTENGTALSSKYLGISTSIPHTQISDWESSVSNMYLPFTGGKLTGELECTSDIVSSLSASDVLGTASRIGVVNSAKNAGWLMSYGSGGDLQYWSSSANNWAKVASLSSNGTFSAYVFTEGGATLASKYLGVNASIPHTQISDWSNYINQALLTTSSPTFATVTANLTGHASLDIPLTGSSAITGALIPNGSTYTLGNSSNTWQLFGNIVSASAGFEGNLTGNVTGNVTGSASLNLLLAGGDLSGHLGLKSTQVTGSSSYAVSHSDCGTIIFQNNTYGVNVTLGTNNNVGDWIISCSNGGINISGVSAKYKGVTYTNSASLASATANVGVLKCLWDGTYWWIG